MTNTSIDPSTLTSNKKIDVSGILAKKAMIAKLSTSCWSARKTDKEATEELLETKKAEKQAGSFSKVLIDKKHLKKIREVINIMKKYHNANTLPWDNDGGRLLPSAKHSDYSSFLRQTKRELDAAVAEFVKDYPTYVADASFMLSDLYESSDYPDPTEMKEKFSIESDFSKVPESSDFRVDIPEFEQKKICQQIESRVEQQHAESMEKIWKRIYNTIAHMHDRLSDEDAIFRNSMVENIDQLVSVLPQLNILENKALDDMAVELKNTLCGYEADELRKDKDLRKEVALKSNEMLEKISSFMDFSKPVKAKIEPEDLAAFKDQEDQEQEESIVQAA